ncbi:CGI-121-domain-containing protein [Sparassis latifolia]
METFHYAHFPPELSHVHIALFTNVVNAAQLRARIVEASLAQGPDADAQRAAVNFAFIDASLICSVSHLQTAVVAAILAQVQGTLRTKTVHSEILWALNPSNNITEALRRYGVSDSSTAIFVVRIASPELHDVDGLMKAVVSGDMSPLSALDGITDWTSVKKYNKLNCDPAIKMAAGKDGVQEHRVVDEIVLSMVAMKSVMG